MNSIIIVFNFSFFISDSGFFCFTFFLNRSSPYLLLKRILQGSSFDKVFIDIDSFKRCRDLEEVRQLQYVGLSRTRSDIYLLK